MGGEFHVKSALFAATYFMGAAMAKTLRKSQEIVKWNVSTSSIVGRTNQGGFLAVAAAMSALKKPSLTLNGFFQDVSSGEKHSARWIAP
jgi:hypothetical protein